MFHVHPGALARPHEKSWVVSAKASHPDYFSQIEHDLWQVGGSFASVKVEPHPKQNKRGKEGKQ
jgi:hypothetical protein